MGRMRRTCVAGGSVAVLALLLLAPVARGETYEDEQLGFSISIPSGWRQIPIAGEERYIVARWQSEREYADKVEGWGHRPELKIVLFDPKGRRSAEVKEKADGSKEIDVVNPYRTYKDWVASDATGGRYISKEEPTTVNGMQTTWYEVAYEKLTVPRHGLAFVYHTEDVDWCVTTEVLEQHWQKLSPALIQCLKSFKTFPRKGVVKREVTEGDDVVVTTDLTKMTPLERHRARVDRLERNLRIATERLTDGWKVKRSKNYVAISHVDDKYTAVVLEQAEAVLEWAEKNLAFFGDGLPAPEILRICKDGDEESAFRDLSSRSGGWSREITLARTDGFWGFGSVADAVFDRWLQDKNPRLAWSMPPWLRQGLGEWIRSAYVKGGKLLFRPDGDLIVALKLAAKQKTLIPPREMIQISDDELMEREKAANTGGPSVGGMPIPGFGTRTSPWQQAAGLVRWLLDGPGKSDKRAKDLLRLYVTNLDAYVKEQDEKVPEGQTYEEPKTEEEEEERFKNRKSFWKDHEKDLLKAVFERAFREWTDADWTAIEKSYRSFAN